MTQHINVVTRVYYSADAPESIHVAARECAADRDMAWRTAQLEIETLQSEFDQVTGSCRQLNALCVRHHLVAVELMERYRGLRWLCVALAGVALWGWCR